MRRRLQVLLSRPTDPGPPDEIGHTVNSVKVEILVVPGCPNEHPARDAVRAAALVAGIPEPTIRVTVVDTPGEAERRRFAGSPTFLVNGIDPFIQPGSPIGLSCRFYPTTDGLRGVPGIHALIAALTQ